MNGIGEGWWDAWMVFGLISHSLWDILRWRLGLIIYYPFWNWIINLSGIFNWHGTFWRTDHDGRNTRAQQRCFLLASNLAWRYGH